MAPTSNASVDASENSGDVLESASVLVGVNEVFVTIAASELESVSSIIPLVGGLIVGSVSET